jgi:outer membrane protein assembly factor BamA
MKFYGSGGFLDSSSIPETEPGSNGIITLKVTVDEGPQYHMGKLEILAGKEIAARLRAEWQMTEGSTYDNTYIRKFIEQNSSLLPEGVTARDARQVMNCPEGVVDVSLALDPREGKSELPVKSIPCESHNDQSK